MNTSIQTNQTNQYPIRTNAPPCVDVEGASAIFGWPLYFFPVLVRAGHLKPLGKPAQNARKWYSTLELQRLSTDLAWLDKAVRIVEKHVHDLNYKKRHRTADSGPTTHDEPPIATAEQR